MSPEAFRYMDEYVDRSTGAGSSVVDERISNPPWWRVEDGDEAKRAKKVSYIMDSKIVDDVCIHYDPWSRSNMFSHWLGSMVERIWHYLFIFMFAGGMFFWIYTSQSDMECSDAAADDLKCRPKWFDEQITAMSLVATKISHLAHLVLVTYLAINYKRFNSIYWNCREVQGAINNLALIVGSSLDHEKKDEISLSFRKNFERHLNLLHMLMYAAPKTSPIIQHLVTLETLRDQEALGMKLLADEEEYHVLRAVQHPQHPDKPTNGVELPGSSGTGPMNHVLIWLVMGFNKAIDHEVFRDNIGHSRSVSLSVNFNKNIRVLRGAMAKFGFEQAFMVPLAYAQMLQHLVDVLCILSPFTVMYGINTDIIKQAGYDEYNRYITIYFTLFAIAIYVGFYQGLLALAQVLQNPLGTRIELRGPKKYKHPDLYLKEFSINVKQILKQTRCLTYTFFNVSDFAPDVCHKR